MQFGWEIVALSPVAYITVDLKKVVSRAISRWFHAGSTMVESKSPCIMSVQYTGGCAVQWGISVHQGEIMSTVGGIMSTLRGVQYTGEYHEYTEEISW